MFRAHTITAIFTVVAFFLCCCLIVAPQSVAENKLKSEDGIANAESILKDKPSTADAESAVKDNLPKPKAKSLFSISKIREYVHTCSIGC